MCLICLFRATQRTLWRGTHQRCYIKSWTHCWRRSPIHSYESSSVAHETRMARIPSYRITWIFCAPPISLLHLPQSPYMMFVSLKVNLATYTWLSPWHTKDRKKGPFILTAAVMLKEAHSKVTKYNYSQFQMVIH